MRKSARHFTIKEKVLYHWDNLMSRGPGAMLLVLVFGTSLLVLTAAFGLTLLGLHHPETGPLPFLENAWLALMRTLDPGNASDDRGWAFRAATLTLTLGGIFIVSCLISILSAGLQVRIDELRKGRSLVVEKNHIIVLGWSPKIFTILNELVLSNESRRDACVVIMARKDKVEMEDELRLKLPRRRKLRIVCRSGNPTDPHDLELVSPHRSKSIVILAPDGPNPDAEIIKTILALTHKPREKGRPYHIVAEIRHAENVALTRLVGKHEVECVAADDLVARMTVQATRQLGLSLVYTELMDFGGGEMYFHTEPSLVTRPFSEAILSYPTSTVMGLQSKDGQVTVNPEASRTIQAGDRLVVLAHDDSTVGASRKLVRATHTFVAERFPHQPGPERILILGWNDTAPIIMRELDRYLPRGSALTVVSTYDVGQLFDEQMPMLRNMTGEYWTSLTSDRQVLEGLDLHHYHHALVLAYSNHLDPQECDSQTLMTLLHLRDLCDRSGHRMGLLSEMLDIRNRELAAITQADDFIVSDRLVSLVLAQVTENKHVMRIFDDLFHIEGSEVFLRPVEEYVPVDATVNFYAVCESCIAKNETPLGYRVKELHHDPAKHYGLVLNPDKSKAITFRAGDQVVVLADSKDCLPPVEEEA